MLPACERQTGIDKGSGDGKRNRCSQACWAKSKVCGQVVTIRSTNTPPVDPSNWAGQELQRPDHTPQAMLQHTAHPHSSRTSGQRTQHSCPKGLQTRPLSLLSQQKLSHSPQRSISPCLTSWVTTQSILSHCIIFNLCSG